MTETSFIIPHFWLTKHQRLKFETSSCLFALFCHIYSVKISKVPKRPKQLLNFSKDLPLQPVHTLLKLDQNVNESARIAFTVEQIKVKD